jgi:hypothetical protein
MRTAIFTLLLTVAAAAQQLPPEDAVRVGEFYRLAERVQDHVWPGWSGIPAPLLLVTKDSEFLTHHPSPPKDFARSATTCVRVRASSICIFRRRSRRLASPR